MSAAAAQCKPNSGPDNVDAIKRFFQDIEANAAAGQETFLPQEVKLVASEGVRDLVSLQLRLSECKNMKAIAANVWQATSAAPRVSASAP